ncbi:deleted in malignant brain tumors 1 protein-like [Pomacea canaliculata]|uniref:deleted in malignant brain tumors 1 protein-like n=1 Tax=Pomacea canaliculata TaxID=400727 RepID=UPI000D72F9BD|nr:deleted in malignant brain tumors 1 protein-like [Pomacea canaliculata]
MSSSEQSTSCCLPLSREYLSDVIMYRLIAYCLICFVMIPPSGGQLTARLANGTSTAGRLEVLYNGQWGTVCDDGFDENDARVACRMLGFYSPEVLAVQSPVFGAGSGNISLDDLACRGTETSLAQCGHSGYYSHNCGHSEDVGVVCNVLSNQLRLAGTRRTRWDMGRVEMLFGAEWTAPCVSGLSSSLAKVLCRQMNYPSKAATAVESSSFGPRTGRFLVAGIVCRGMESNILDCIQTFTGFSDTCSSPELGVICSDLSSSLFIVVETSSTSPAYPLMEGTKVTLKCVSSQRGLSHLNFSWPETAGGRPSGEYLIFDNLTRSHNGGRVRCMASYGQPPRMQIVTSDTLAMDVYSVQLTARLANGTWWAGRLEVLYDGRWNTVCDDDFDKNDARVACRMLGFDSPEALFVGSEMYGAGSGNILLDDLACTGTETSLAQCTHQGYNNHNCNHRKDVGVVCTVLSSQLRLAGTRRTRQDIGRVEILFGAAWTTPCVGTFSSSLAKVLCRQMNFPSKAATAVEPSSFGPRTGRFLVAGIVCTGMESNILDCFQTFTGFSDTCSSSELGVICSDSSSSLFIVVETSSTSTAYPLMEGTNVTLKCVSSQRGLSHLNFSWPETAGGRPSGEYLIFDNLTRSHNGGRVRCMASYGQPPRTQIATSDTLAMDVYYRPVIRIKWEGNTCEPLESSPSRCVVSQYQQVILYCEADSNPPPASVRWSGQAESVSGQLQISSAYKTDHNGLYFCIVSSESVSSDGRLPLSSTYSFEVIVKYRSHVLNFQINAEARTAVTVAENSSVRMRCEAEGRPSPHMTIVSVSNNKQEVASRPRGAVQSPDQRGEVTYDLTAAPCEAAGDYRCEVDNGVGQESRNIRLYVECAPRINNGEREPAILTSDVNQGLFSFQLTAYPTPKVKNILYLGQYTNDSTEGTSVSDKIYVNCEMNSSFPASVICNITTINMTNADEGFYKVIFSNEFGELPVMFLVRSNEDRGVNVKVIIGAAVGTVAVLVVVIIVTVCIARHCRVKKSLSRHAEANTRQALETTVPLEDMKSSGATNNYYGQNARSEVMNMPQEKDIVTEDLYVNTAELAREDYDSDHEYSDVDDIDNF